MSKFKSDFMNEMDVRGFLNQSTDFEALDRHFATGARTAYLGCDPTADSLHVGHLIPVMMMRWLQRFGHRPILLVGGATGYIGDPDKDTERPLLTPEKIAANSRGLKRSYEKFLEFKGKGAAAMVDNYDWFRDMGYLKFLREVGTMVSVNKLVTLDRIKKRLDAELHLSFLELNYPLLQSYDFLVLYEKFGCDVQICGADQWGNAIGGVDLIRRKKNADAFVLSAPLLLAANGRKMGKSEGNAAWVNDDRASAYDYYQFFRNADDRDVGKMLRFFTDLPMKEVERLEKLSGSEINGAKKVLAFEATKICRGYDDAKSAEATARDTFEKRGAGADLPVFQYEPGMGVIDAFVTAGLAKSKGEARRLLAGGGLYVNEHKIADEKFRIAPEMFRDGVVILSAGKKNKAVLRR
ncbi:MAG: tyrosine--tRNA ligase [Rickettsiales bacterium]|jgi:tyrosyl-tRNA synthetase|nr:tyrosine--tRNA ligase [Rickettsiales bacterium]